MSNFILPLILLIAFPTTSLPGTEAVNNCPRKCQCIWRDAKITVDCSNQTLASIPTTVERNTQVLNISGNDIPIFGRAHFSRLGLINLQRVSCARCNLVSVDAKAFLGLTNLVELDLSNNKLVEVSKGFNIQMLMWSPIILSVGWCKPHFYSWPHSM